ncbi:hypothetical protein ACIRPR_21385 [Streptomyces griseoflavus]|uniref:hypothetical protein n=1 Tax=Streptomyces griseoflavus TaxID=35619 RepID=UPI003802E7C0
MSEAGRNAIAFFVLGILAFVTGIVFWAVSGRADAMLSFACSAVVFAGAWLFERLSTSRTSGE